MNFIVHVTRHETSFVSELITIIILDNLELAIILELTATVFLMFIPACFVSDDYFWVV